MENSGKQAQIWAVAGGKGGTGKSFITSSMGTCLALRGRRTILLDADLGGANLHSFFGLVRPRHSLTDFFEKKIPLDQIVMPSGVANLGLVTGALGSLDSESINFGQKQKLFRHVRGLAADNVLIDLGGGSHVNTLDTFLLADRMVVVTVPEITAIENMYHFLKSAYFRKLRGIFKAHNLGAFVQDIWKNRLQHGIHSLRDLISHLKQSSDEILDILDTQLGSFTVYLVLNQVRSHREILVGENLKRVCITVLGLPVIYAGYSSSDDAVQKNINNKEPFMLFNRLSPVVGEIRAITENIAAGTGFPMPRDLVNGIQ